MKLIISNLCEVKNINFQPAHDEQCRVTPQLAVNLVEQSMTWLLNLTGGLKLGKFFLSETANSAEQILTVLT
jgi:hypothetical protein